MADITVSLRLARPIGDLFSGVLEVLDRPFAGARGVEAIRLLRESVRKEFEQGAWARPEGGFSRWEKVEAFGIRPAPATPLNGTGGFLSLAWQGGQFGFEEKGDRRVAIGVQHDAAPVHRGGDPNPSNEYVTTVPITLQMRKRVGREFHTGFPKDVDSFEIPARPHATTNPVLEENMVQLFGKALASISGSPA